MIPYNENLDAAVLCARCYSRVQYVGGLQFYCLTCKEEPQARTTLYEAFQQRSKALDALILELHTSLEAFREAARNTAVRLEYLESAMASYNEAHDFR